MSLKAHVSVDTSDRSGLGPLAPDAEPWALTVGPHKRDAPPIDTARSRGAASRDPAQGERDLLTRAMPDGGAEPKALLTELLVTLDRAGVKACYWKSRRRVDAALAGHKDLDLLVAHEDQHRVAERLLACGFKLFPSVPLRDHPSVASYVGYDAPSGSLLHVHLHLRLVVGERLLKNMRLPWERCLLDRAVRHPTQPLWLLDPAADALMLLVRACLEMNPLDPLAREGWHASLARYREDLATVLASLSPRDVTTLAERLLGAETGRLVGAALTSGDPLAHRVRLRRRLKRCLSGYNLYGPAEAQGRALVRAAFGLAGRINRTLVHGPRPWSRRAPGGGCVVAVVGLDGSGKSTAVATLRQWLMPEVDVMPIYFGTGEGRPSLLLAPFKLLVPLAELVFRRKPAGSSHGTITGLPPGLAYTVCLSIWATLVAIEKRGKLKRARRAAGRGMVVIADRYPQNEIPTFNDGPLLHRLRHVPALLRRFEERTYARAAAMPPDLVLKLVAAPEMTARREPTMCPGVIAQRVEEFSRLVFHGARVVTIDANRSLDVVTREIKEAVWSAL